MPRRVVVVLALVSCSPPGAGPSPSASASVAPSALAPTASAQLAPAPAAPPLAAVVRLEGGSFRMGTEAAAPGLAEEKPAHVVTVASFEIDATEVTVAAYKACVDAGACSSTDLVSQRHGRLNEEFCTWGRPGLEEHPITCVNWDEAVAYCRWLGMELPTEEQWEYAARGPTGRNYPWGPGAPGARWALPPALEDTIGCACPPLHSTPTCAVGAFPAGDTPEGVKDLSSNVAEWTSSTFCPYLKPGCDETAKVVRGGSCSRSSYREEHRGVSRAGKAPRAKVSGIGFRCAKPLTARPD